MTIQQYLSHRQISVEQFAEELGVHNTTLYRWRKGGDIKTSELQNMIDKSGGLITAADVLITNGKRKPTRRRKRKAA